MSTDIACYAALVEAKPGLAACAGGTRGCGTGGWPTHSGAAERVDSFTVWRDTASQLLVTSVLNGSSRS